VIRGRVIILVSEWTTWKPGGAVGERRLRIIADAVLVLVWICCTCGCDLSDCSSQTPRYW
jgi:hypothetical protein